MKLHLFRFTENKDSTLGRLFIDGKQLCFTLEDGHREIKIPGKTRIPAGMYEIVKGPDNSPLTLKYREKYKEFFKNHIEVKGVKDFANIYVHCGNYVTQTEGCLLVGGSYILGEGDHPHSIGKSVATFKDLYALIYPKLESGEFVTLEIS